MNLYLSVLEVIGAAATPVLVLFLVRLAIVGIENRTKWLERDIEEAKKEPPFDRDAEWYEVPNPTMIGIRLKKGDKVVWEGAVDKEGYGL